MQMRLGSGTLQRQWRVKESALKSAKEKVKERVLSAIFGADI